MLKRPLSMFVLCFLLYQIFCMWWFPDLKKESPLQEYDGKTITCVGVVGRREETTDYHIYYLEEIQCAPLQEQLSNQKLLVYVEKSDKTMVQVGNRVQITGEICLFDIARNPGMFDQSAYYEKQSICASVWEAELQIVETQCYELLESLTVLRLNWQNELVRVLGEKNGQLLSAMLLGDKRDMDDGIKESYQLSGIGHVLAISGLHMSFLGSGLYQMLRKRGVSFAVSGLIGCVFLGGYALMIGGGVSSIRALAMYIVRMGAEVAGRTYDRATSLAIAAFVIVAEQPLYLTDAGFLLSFGAILGILVFEPILRRMCPASPNKILKWLSDSVCGSLSIHLMLFPILLYFYYEFSLYSLILNLFVIPLMSVVLGTGVFGSIFLVLGLHVIPIFQTIGEWMLKSCGLILDFYEMLAKDSLQMPLSRIVVGQPQIWQLGTYYLLLGLSYGICRWHIGRAGNTGEFDCRKRRMLRRVLLGGYVLATVFCAIGHGNGVDLQITMLDVGQGDAIVIRAPKGQTCMVDGGSSDVSSVGRYRLETYLKSQGISRLDYVFVTHGDEDHCSGVLEMLKRQERGVIVKKLVLPAAQFWDEMLFELAGTAQSAGVEVAVINAGETLAFGEMTIRCIQPDREDAIESGNAASMVLELTYGAFDMLLTGDVEAEGEEVLTERIKGKTYEVLKVAHHGSKNSSGEVFLDIVRPKIALISAGRDNRYGHPHQETTERLEAAGSEIYNTQESGAVTITVCDQRMRVVQYLF